MKCSNCGGELLFENGIGVCASCKSTHRIENAFENTEVCICYLENDQNGRRTKDSMIAAEVYKKLESKKINCFYEHISAGNVIGDDLEIIRYAAISHAKIIVLVGTSADNFSTLYDKYREAFGEKRLISVISDMKPEQLPEKLRRFQASNFDSLGALNDLSISVLNLIGRGEEVELEEIYNKKKKKKKTLIIVLVSLLVAMLCVAVALAIVFWPEKEVPVVLTDDDIYNSAIALVNEQKYLEAAKEFNKILNYKDSSNQIKKIYDRYDGYYQDEEGTCSLYINIIDGKSAEFSFEKIKDNKIIKAEDSMILQNNQITGRYIDNLLNEGNISVIFDNEYISLNISTDLTSNEISFGNIHNQFQVKNKTDRPPIKTVTKELLLSWMKSLTYLDDVKASGYELEYIEEESEIHWNFGEQYKVANTDITIVTTDEDLTKYKGEYSDNPPKLEKSAVVAVIAPANLVCPEKINQSACVFSEDEIVYVPNTTNITENYDSNNKYFLNFMVDGSSETINTTETRTMNELTVKADSMVGVSSKQLIGEYNYNTIINENKRIYYKTLVLQQYQKDNPNTTETFVVPRIVAEVDGALLINVHSRELNGGLDYGMKGTFSYYRFDLSTKKCSLITKHKQVSYINQYGSRTYSYDEWQNYPDLFDEFITEPTECNHVWEDATCTTPKVCLKCQETSGTPSGHSWSNATCTEPRICEDCGETDGEPSGHTWTFLSCTEPNVCEECGESDDYIAGHDWITATCSDPMICSVCEKTSGEPLEHVWSEATCETPATCVYCGETGDYGLCNFTDIRFEGEESFKYCEVCGAPE